MKKITGLCFSILAIANGYSQYKLSTISIGPRVGESIIVSCSLENGKDYEGSISFTSMETVRTGPFVVGPFTVNQNGKTYHTDSLVIDIAPALPEAPDGIWLRIFKQDGVLYIEVNQRSSIKLTKETYIDFNTEKFNNAGVELKEVEEITMGYNKVYEKTMVYKITKNEQFKKMKLSSDYFINVPSNVKIESATLE